MYIENGDFSRTVLMTGQSNMRGHNKYFLQDNKLYHFTITGCIGEDDAVEIGKGYTGEVYNPYNDPNYHCKVIPASMVYEVLTNPENGAGATLDEDLLVTRGNPDYQETTGVQRIDAGTPSVTTIRYYAPSGRRISRLQKGINIIEFQMSDGTTKTQKIYNQ
jgi:hypothetical protein